MYMATKLTPCRHHRKALHNLPSLCLLQNHHPFFSDHSQVYYHVIQVTEFRSTSSSSSDRFMYRGYFSRFICIHPHHVTHSSQAVYFNGFNDICIIKESVEFQILPSSLHTMHINPVINGAQPSSFIGLQQLLISFHHCPGFLSINEHWAC